MPKLLGIDVGTSGAKAVLVDERGKVLRQASAEYPLSTPKPLWSEQDPEDWWKGVQKCLADIGESKPDAIGLTGQMHGAVFLNKDQDVIRPAILWNDQRTAKECREIDDLAGAERVRKITRNPPLTGFQAPKILWLRNEEPENFRRLEQVLLPKDFIRWKLSGEKATEVSDACGTGLFDVANRRWSEELLSALDLDPSLFPQSTESYEISSKTKGTAGLEGGIPIVGGGGDQAAGAVGTGAVVPGVVSISLGTSGVVFTSLEEPSYDERGRVHTFCHANGAWHAMGVMLSCGGALRWFRNVLGSGKTYDDLANLAATAPAGSDGLTFLPYLSGERTPHNDPHARAAFVGATLSHSLGHFSRAVFEGATFGLADSLTILRELGANPVEVRVTGGGARSAFWLQMIADVLAVTCVTLDKDEGPALGAALLAGVGVGVWPSVSKACEATVRIAGKVEPRGKDYGAAYSAYRDLYLDLRGAAKE